MDDFGSSISEEQQEEESEDDQAAQAPVRWILSGIEAPPSRFEGFLKMAVLLKSSM